MVCEFSKQFLLKISICFVLIHSFISVQVLASPNYLNLQSRISKPNNEGYLEAASVQFRITVTDPVGTCVLFQEDYSSVNMSGSKGLVNLKIGTGTKSYPLGAMPMNELFNNFGSPVFNCQTSGTFTASSTDLRKLILQFNDGSGWQTVPAMEVNSVPYALGSMTAQKLGAYNASDYARKAEFTSCTGSEAVHFNGTSFTCVAVGGAASYSSLTGATGANTIDNSNHAQSWNWSTASTQNPMTMTANALTTGSLLNLTTSNNSLNSTSGILNVANTGSSTSGTVARIQSNSTAGSGLTVLANGNVGVGTTTPGRLLQVGYSTLNADTYIRSSADAGRYAALEVQSGGSSWDIGTQASGASPNNALFFRSSGFGVQMTVTESGNVGVGTTTPGARLEVKNAITGLSMKTTNSVGNQIVGVGENVANAGYVRVYDNAGTLKSFLNADPADNPLIFASALTNKPDGAETSYGAGLAIHTPYTVGQENGIFFGNSSSLSSPAGAAITFFTSDTSNYGRGGLKFKTSNSGSVTTRMTIEPTGNVGVGITTPAAKLHVIGDVIATKAASTSLESAVSASAFASGTATGIMGGYFYAQPLGSGANIYGTQAIVEQTTMGASTTANAYGSYAKVQTAAGNTNFTNAYSFYADSGGGTLPTNGYGLYLASIAGTNNWGVYQSSATNKNYFAGNVGIGTTNPTSKLHVIGGATTISASPASTGTLNVIRNTGVTGSPNIMLDNVEFGANITTEMTFNLGGSEYSSIFGGTDGSNLGILGIEVAGSERMRINSSGNVGIGTSSPDSKLQVDGHVWPETTATSNLGSSSLRWNNIYLSNAPDVSSDARLKKDVKDSDLGLEFINSLRPVSWIWKDANQGSTSHYGVIAQETERAVRKAKGYNSSNVIVSHNEENDSYSVRYTELISPLIKAIQELYNQLTGVNREIASVQVKTSKLEADNIAKDKEIAELKARLEQQQSVTAKQQQELNAIKNKLGL